MAEVTPLRGAAVPAANEASQEVLDLLKEIIEKAERGEIVCLSAAWVTPGGTTSCSWASAFGFSFNLLAAIDIMHDLFRQVLVKRD